MAPVIRLTTPVPGPASQALMRRRQAAVPRGVPATTPIAIVRAENAVVTDVDGNHFIDFGGGIGVVNVGHRHPGVVEAVREQLDHFTHVCFPVSMYESYIALAEKLNALAPGDHPKKTFFVNSGAEAVENAVKVARHFTGRQAIVAFEHGFHGRTYMGMSLTAKVQPYKQGFGPFAPEVYRIPFPYRYRMDGAEAARYCDGDRTALEHAFVGLVDPGSVAAVILELEVGEGGFIPAPAGLCGHAGAVLPRPRHPLHRRRDPDRFWPHRADLCGGALQSCPRHYHDGEITGRRAAAGRDYRPG